MARRSFRRSTPSLKSWQSTNDGTKNAPLDGSITLGAPGTTGTPVFFIGSATIEDFTILRTRGLWGAGPTVGTFAQGDQLLLSVGLGVVPNVAGQVSFPSPIVDADWDGWFLHETILLRGQTSGVPVADLVNQVVDSKAMRKVHGGDSLLAAFDVHNVNSAATALGFAFWARFLLKLS